MPTVHITLLGGFAVTVDDVAVPEKLWTRRHAAALVKVLALAPDRRLHREQIIDLVWPDDTIDEAAPKLHKAAHFARRAIGVQSSLVLRGESVALLPDAEATVDVIQFELLARRARADDDATAAARPSSCTPVTCFRRTATRNGRRIVANSCAPGTSTCCGSMVAGSRSSRSTTPTRSRISRSCGCTRPTATGTPRCGSSNASTAPCGGSWVSRRVATRPRCATVCSRITTWLPDPTRPWSVAAVSSPWPRARCSIPRAGEAGCSSSRGRPG